jgi:hypothetical protein
LRRPDLYREIRFREKKTANHLHNSLEYGHASLAQHRVSARHIDDQFYALVLHSSLLEKKSADRESQTRQKFDQNAKIVLHDNHSFGRLAADCEHTLPLASRVPMGGHMRSNNNSQVINCRANHIHGFLELKSLYQCNNISYLSS